MPAPVVISFPPSDETKARPRAPTAQLRSPIAREAASVGSSIAASAPSPFSFTCRLTCSRLSRKVEVKATDRAGDAMADRKEQIVKKAIEIVAEEGYGNLSMRAVARAS